MYRIIYFLLIMPVVASAQKDSGIQFEKELSWQQILTKAKTESKFIFVDYYATWCIPCRKMDREVYTSNALKEIMNDRFISVKVQFDSSRSDNAYLINWRKDAKMLRDSNHIQSLPTYLFFTPEGGIVHRGEGYKDTTAFRSLVMDALDTTRQYYTLMKKYYSGKIDYREIDYLINAARELGRKSLEDSIAQHYIGDHLLKQQEDRLYTNQNINFIARYTHNTADRGFSFFYKHAERINKLMQKDHYAENIIKDILYNQYVYPMLQNKQGVITEKKWTGIERQIASRYNTDIARRVIIDAQMEYYRLKGDWEQYVDLLIKKVDTYGVYGQWSEDFNLNSLAWEIFLHSFDIVALNKALSWSNSAIKIKPAANWMDTKANILYKLGRKEEALACQQEAVKIGSKDINAGDYMANLNKMKLGKPTWPLK